MSAFGFHRSWPVFGSFAGVVPTGGVDAGGQEQFAVPGAGVVGAGVVVVGDVEDPLADPVLVGVEVVLPEVEAGGEVVPPVVPEEPVVPELAVVPELPVVPEEVVDPDVGEVGVVPPPVEVVVPVLGVVPLVEPGAGAGIRSRSFSRNPRKAVSI